MAWSEARGVREPSVVPGLPEKLQEMIETASPFGITMIMVDTAPHSDKGALAAMRAADLIICPTQPSLFDVVALKDTVELLKMAGRIDRAIAVVNGLPTKGKDDAYAEADAAVTALGIKVAKANICHRRPFVLATGHGRGVTETYESKGIPKADREGAAKDIEKLWKELNGMVPVTAAKTSKEKVS
jgi:chromosome partitioning protein